MKFGVVVFLSMLLSNAMLVNAETNEVPLPEERVFKETTVEIRRLLSIEPQAGIPYRETIKQLETQQSRFDELYRTLSNFLKEFPNSVYADDAAFLLAQIGPVNMKLTHLDVLINRYPEGRLEKWSIENLSSLLPISTPQAPERLGLLTLARFERAHTLSGQHQYEDSNRGMWEFINQFTHLEEQDLKEIPQVAFAYMTLERNYIALKDNKGLERVYRDATTRLPTSSLKDYFANKAGIIQ